MGFFIVVMEFFITLRTSVSIPFQSEAISLMGPNITLGAVFVQYCMNLRLINDLLLC